MQIPVLCVLEILSQVHGIYNFMTKGLLDRYDSPVYHHLAIEEWPFKGQIYFCLGWEPNPNSTVQYVNNITDSTTASLLIYSYETYLFWIYVFNTGFVLNYHTELLKVSLFSKSSKFQLLYVFQKRVCALLVHIKRSFHFVNPIFICSSIIYPKILNNQLLQLTVHIQPRLLYYINNDFVLLTFI